MLSLHPLTILASLSALVLAFVFPQLSFLQTLLLSPAFFSLFLCVFISTILYLLIRRQLNTKTSLISNGRRPIKSLVFTTSTAWSSILARDTTSNKPSSPSSLKGSYGSRKSLDNRLDRILNLITQTFILPWYTRISPSPIFPQAVQTLVRSIIIDLATRSNDVDWSTILVSKIIPIITDHMHHYRSVEHLSSRSLPLPLPKGAHRALALQPELTGETTTVNVEEYLRGVVIRVLECVLPPEEKTEVVKTMAREIVLCSILMPVLDMLSEPDFWNRQIDEKGGQYLHEQKQVNKFLSALSTIPYPSNTSSPMTTRGYTGPLSTSSISINSTSQQFDVFIRSIAKVKSLGEARRLRADIERESRHAKSMQMDSERSEGVRDDKQVKRLIKFVQRLERARISVDARIQVLTGQQRKTSDTNIPHVPTADPTLINLRSVLSDPSSLAYWLEYMDRRGRSRLVQFWLTVEGFKNPLDLIDPTVDPLVSTPWDEGDLKGFAANKDDISFLVKTYLNVPDNNLGIPVRHSSVLQNFCQTSSDHVPETNEVQRVKQATFAAQQAVFEQMEDDDWPEFTKTELYLKALSDLRLPSSLVPIPSRDTRASSEERTSSLSPPAHPLRRFTTPLSPVSHNSIPSSKLRSAPKLVNGSFTPAVPRSSASVSVTPPTFDPPLKTEPKHRAVSADEKERMTSGLVSPVPMTRRSSHLDVLMSPDREVATHHLEKKLFDDDDDISGPIVQEDEEDDFAQLQRMKAIQAALDEIIRSDDLSASMTTSLPPPTEPEVDSADALSSSLVLPRRNDEDRPATKLGSRSFENLKSPVVDQNSGISSQERRPSSIQDASVDRPPFHRRTSSKVSLPQERRLFEEDELKDDVFDVEEDIEDGVDAIQPAVAGDLQLPLEIARLQDKIDYLVRQESLLEDLIRKAELTGNAAELKILHRSQSSIKREQRTALFQKAQFEQQEAENRLVPGRTRVVIPSSVITAEEGEHGKQVVRYTIEVSQIGEDAKVLLNWVVARRYNEFFELDRAIREWAATSGDPRILEEFKTKVGELPGKKLVANMSTSFIDNRRIGLEKYLQSLITSSIICDSHILRSFLSRSSIESLSSNDTSPPRFSIARQNIVKALYKTMATSFDDSIGPNMLDFMYTGLNRQLSDVAGGIGAMTGFGGEDLTSLGPTSSSTSNNLVPDPHSKGSLPVVQPMGGENALTSFTSPICDLFIEVFDLKENNWLRRQAIIVILQQFLGGTIERKVRDTIINAFSHDSLERILYNFQEIMWPEGNKRSAMEPRTELEKDSTRLRASRKLGLLIPDVAANMIGRNNARRAARRGFGVLQDRRLNQHLFLCIIDEVVNALFPSEPS
ncbi:hypothetical protein M231_02401 [Tremella mesenterica]|uniref:Intermediate filament protein n=1 Tax=Tremella mesenterica TaxID=5217 RepID=A0A4V1M4G5_TREME|nr:hypothetical protein M231_02401 [Tremella mesenterica]